MSNVEYSVNRHSCYYLKYHLVVCVKYRHPVLSNEAVKNDLISIAERIFTQEWHCTIDDINIDNDHVHILFSAPPQVQLSKLINNFKTVSSRLIRKNHEEYLSKYFWKPYFWSNSYFIGTVSEVSEQIVSQYIKDQDKKNKE